MSFEEEFRPALKDGSAEIRTESVITLAEIRNKNDSLPENKVGTENKVGAEIKREPLKPDDKITATVMVRCRATEKEIADTLDKIAEGKISPLSAKEYATKFGADQGALSRVLKFAADHNLQAREVNQESGRVYLSGKAKDFSAAFEIDLDKLQKTGSEGPFQPRSGYSLPKSIEKDVDGVFGFDKSKIAEPRSFENEKKKGLALPGLEIS